MLLVAMTIPLQDEAVGDRRRGGERRCKVLPFSTERRQGADRRCGLDRRGGSLETRDQLRSALAMLIRAAEDPTLDDTTLRQVDVAVLRIWAALEALETP
jgi:hypothetical protein